MANKELLNEQNTAKKELIKLKNEYKKKYRITDILRLIGLSASSFGSLVNKNKNQSFSLRNLHWIIKCFKEYIKRRDELDKELKLLFKEYKAEM